MEVSYVGMVLCTWEIWAGGVVRCGGGVKEVGGRSRDRRDGLWM